MNIVIVGLAMSSSWGNGHATTYRGLTRALAARGHDVLFLERDVPWYASSRDLASAPYCRIRLYRDQSELAQTSTEEIASADLVIVGSYVPDGIAVADFVLRTAEGCTAFYDIDTPITLAALDGEPGSYIARRQIGEFDLYLSFTGGPTLERLERELGAQRARPLYCSVDPEWYFPDEDARKDYDLGYLGTYSVDRQASLNELLIAPAAASPERRFVIAGSQYPADFSLPGNVEHITHLAPAEHRSFYNRQRFALNVTRRDMIAAGHSPSVRLFEAAACGTPIISDDWPGLDQLFSPGREILIARNITDVLGYLRDLPEIERAAIAARARRVVLESHTASHRAIELEQCVAEVVGQPTP